MIGQELRRRLEALGYSTPLERAAAVGVSPADPSDGDHPVSPHVVRIVELLEQLAECRSKFVADGGGHRDALGFTWDDVEVLETAEDLLANIPGAPQPYLADSLDSLRRRIEALLPSRG